MDTEKHTSNNDLSATVTKRTYNRVVTPHALFYITFNSD